MKPSRFLIYFAHGCRKKQVLGRAKNSINKTYFQEK